MSIKFILIIYHLRKPTICPVKDTGVYLRRELCFSGLETQMCYFLARDLLYLSFYGPLSKKLQSLQLNQ